MIKGSDKVYDRSEWDKPVIKQSIPLGLPERPRLYVREREPDNDPMELISRAVAKQNPDLKFVYMVVRLYVRV